MNFLLHLPAFVKVLAAFGAILLIYRLKIPLWLSVAASAAALSLWSGTGINGLGATVGALVLPENYLLVVAIGLLLLFNEALTKSGRMTRTIDALKAYVASRRTLYAALPALIGLLPMPGGALFSAPMVDSLDDKQEIKPELKVAINYWFRHIWEYWWPLYPGVVLAIRYSGLPAPLYFAIQLPLTFAAIAGGYFFILRKIAPSKTRDKNSRPDIAAIASTLLPIFIIVVCTIAGIFVFPRLNIVPALANLCALGIGLLSALCVVFISKPASVKGAFSIFVHRHTWSLIALVLAIQFFSAVIVHPVGPQSATLVSLMRDEFLHLGVPFLLVMMLIPFISGFVTGIAFAFVGASFPLIFGLLDPEMPLHVRMAAAVLSYGCGYLGMIL